MPVLKILFVTFIIVVNTTAVSFAGSELNMQEGKWEITTKVEMPGMPTNMPPNKHIQCLTNNDLVPNNSQQGQECKITQTTIVGNTVRWTIQCKSQGEEMKGNGKITYSGNSLEGTIKMIMSQANMEMISHISGHRIGNCK